MGKTVALIHTTRVVIEPINELIKQIIPEVSSLNLLDEGILKILSKTGSVNSQIDKRICDLAVLAEEAGADLIMLTCSSISSCAEIACNLVNIPILKIDQAMIEKAVDLGQVIGVLATNRTTLKPTTLLIDKVAKEKNKNIVIKTYLYEKAFKALLAGRNDEHDDIILNAINEVFEEVDVIVLAQASLYRLLQKINKNKIKGYVLASPRIAVDHLKKYLRI